MKKILSFALLLIMLVALTGTSFARNRRIARRLGNSRVGRSIRSDQAGGFRSADWFSLIIKIEYCKKPSVPWDQKVLTEMEKEKKYVRVYDQSAAGKKVAYAVITGDNHPDAEQLWLPSKRDYNVRVTREKPCIKTKLVYVPHLYKFVATGVKSIKRISADKGIKNMSKDYTMHFGLSEHNIFAR